MLTRGDIVLLGLSAGVTGAMTGGVLLFLGISLIAGGASLGWLVFLPAAPLGGFAGWLMGRRLARRLPG